MAFVTVRPLARATGLSAVEQVSLHSPRLGAATALLTTGLPCTRCGNFLGHAHAHTGPRYDRNRDCSTARLGLGLGYDGR